MTDSEAKGEARDMLIVAFQGIHRDVSNGHYPNDPSIRLSPLQAQRILHHIEAYASKLHLNIKFEQ
jgi:hypothetical protein